MTTADSAAAAKNGHNNDLLSASPPPSTSERTAEPGHQPNMTQQEGFRAILVEASPRRSDLSKCNICDTKFTIFEHRHMCRMCQDPVCNGCSCSRKVFRAGTKPKRVCDECVKTFPSTTKIVADTTNTIESSGNRPQLLLSASDAADTCAERMMLSPGPVTAFFGIGMAEIPSPRTPPSTTPIGGNDATPTPLAAAFARLQIETINRFFFGGRRASGDNFGKNQSSVQITAATKRDAPASSSSPPPAQQQDRAQGGMGRVTNGGQGQAKSDYAGSDFDCLMPATAVVPAVAAGDVKKVTYNAVALEDADASHGQVSNQANTFDRAVLGLDASHFASTTADTPTNCYTTAAADTASSPLAATPAPPSTIASPPQDQGVVHNEVAAKGTDVSQADVKTKKTGIVNGALFELKAAETDACITTTVETLAGATPSIDIPADAAAELLTKKVQVHNEVTKEDSDAPGHIENDAETAAANLAFYLGQNNGARLTWIHFTSEIICGCLAAVVMGLAVGLHLLERD